MHARLIEPRKLGDPVDALAEVAINRPLRSAIDTVDRVSSSFVGAMCLGICVGIAIDRGIIQRIEPGFGPETSSNAYPFYMLGLACAVSGVYWGSRALIQSITTAATRGEAASDMRNSDT